MAEGPPQMGWAMDWLPDGRLVTTGPRITRHEPDGARGDATARRAPTRSSSTLAATCTSTVRTSTSSGGGAPKPGWINLVPPDGTCREVAGDIAFPNGMVVTPDGSTLVVAESFAGRLSAFDIQDDGLLTGRRVWAEGLGPDGICVDAGSGIWSETADVAARPATRTIRPGPASGCSTAGDHPPRRDRLPCFACASAARRAGTSSCSATSSRGSTSCRRCRRGGRPKSLSPRCRSDERTAEDSPQQRASRQRCADLTLHGRTWASAPSSGRGSRSRATADASLRP